LDLILDPEAAFSAERSRMTSDSKAGKSREKKKYLTSFLMIYFIEY